MEIAAAPVMKTNTDLQDPVVQIAHRCRVRAPEELECLVLLEEFPGVELLDRVQQLSGRSIVAMPSRWLVSRPGGRTLRRPGALAVAARRLRARVRRGALALWR